MPALKRGFQCEEGRSQRGRVPSADGVGPQAQIGAQISRKATARRMAALRSWICLPE
jgi:hypothetical protein